MTKMETQFELDSRMTDETKIYVTNSLSIISPNMIPKLDVNMTRDAREKAADKLLESLTFDNLDIRKLTVKNIHDN